MAISKITDFGNIILAADVDPTSAVERAAFISSWEAFNLQLKDVTVSELNASFDEVDAIYVNIQDVRDTVVEKEALINPHYANIDAVGGNIDAINSAYTNIVDIQNASGYASATEANRLITEQNKDATEVNKDICVSKAAETINSAFMVAGVANINFASFTLNADKELVVDILDTETSTPSLVDGDLIITY